MEYISAEEFLKQPKEVQEVFRDWWEPSAGDLYLYYSTYNNQQDNIAVINKQLEVFPRFKNDIKEFGYQLLTEGQLRKFIEDKTGCKLFIEYYNGSDILIRFMKANKEIKSYMFYNCNDLLRAYWKVACEIAKEELSYDKARTES